MHYVQTYANHMVRILEAAGATIRRMESGRVHLVSPSGVNTMITLERPIQPKRVRSLCSTYNLTAEHFTELRAQTA